LKSQIPNQRPEFAPWETNTERSYYEEQVLSLPRQKPTGTEILVSEKAPPHESV
jgi:hypothetical protein